MAAAVTFGLLGDKFNFKAGSAVKKYFMRQHCISGCYFENIVVI